MLYAEMVFVVFRRGLINERSTKRKWINVEDAAEYLGVKPATIREWIRKKQDMPAHKVGKQWISDALSYMNGFRAEKVQ